jgi:PKD repeat protein
VGRTIFADTDAVVAEDIHHRKSVVEVADIAAGTAEVINYYRDLGQEDSDDTGDLRSFGDAGFRVVDPGAAVGISIAHYVLAPHQAAVGAAYREYRDHPLQTATAAQDFVQAVPSAANFIYAPWPVFHGVETTFTATVAGLEPFTFDWEFGGGGVASGNPVTHTFTVSGTIPVSLTVTNDYGTDAVVRSVLVWEPGAEVPLVYLPLTLRNAP